MRNWIFGLEAINALLGIAVSLQKLSSDWWIVVYIVFVVGVLALFISDKKLEKQVYDKVMADVKLAIKKKQVGTLESISPENRNYIYHLDRDMEFQHGHSDPFGLVADYACGVKLNKLIYGNCSRCNQPRNLKSTSSRLG